MLLRVAISLADFEPLFTRALLTGDLIRYHAGYPKPQILGAFFGLTHAEHICCRRTHHSAMVRRAQFQKLLNEKRCSLVVSREYGNIL